MDAKCNYMSYRKSGLQSLLSGERERRNVVVIYLLNLITMLRLYDNIASCPTITYPHNITPTSCIFPSSVYAKPTDLLLSRAFFLFLRV